MDTQIVDALAKKGIAKLFPIQFFIMPSGDRDGYMSDPGHDLNERGSVSSLNAHRESVFGAPSRDWEDLDHTWDSKYTILHATPTRMHSKGVVLACSPIDAALVATAGGDDRRFLRKIGQGDWAFELQDSMEAGKKSLEKATERVRCLEDDLAKSR
ncbi:hypothetical protein JHK85_010191 [Glycine max]|nr:hypothetical protein JHK85_010191 [Glycine max]